MSFKTIFKMIFVGIISLNFLVGCSLEVGETPRPKLKVVSQQMTCLKDIGPAITSYFYGKLSDEKINSWSACVRNAIVDFESYTVGEDPDVYTIKEVASSVSEVVYPDNPISYKFAAALMELKSYLVGGSSEYVTRVELKEIRQLVAAIKEAAIYLNPEMTILVADTDLGPTEADIERATNKLHLALTRLLKLTQGVGQKLKFQKVEDVFYEFQKFNNGDPTLAKPFVELARSFYNVVTANSDKNNSLLKAESESFVFEFAYWYRLRLLYNYHVSPKSILKGEGLASVKKLVDLALDGVKRVVNRYDEESVSYQQMESLVDGFGGVQLLPQPFSAKSIKSVLRPVFDKVFGDFTLPVEKRANNGVDREVVAKIEAEFYRWYEAQRILSQGFQDQNDSLELRENYFRKEAQWEQFISKVPESSSHLAKVKGLWSSSPLMHSWGDPRLVIAYSDDQQNIRAKSKNYYNLSLLNIISTSVRVVIRGYSTDPIRSQKLYGLTEAEVSHFVEDFRRMWQDLNIMSPDSGNPDKTTDVGKKMFLEGNLFTLSGNGIHVADKKDPAKHLLSFNEGVELLAMLYSSATINKQIYKRYSEVCLVGPRDVFNKSLVVDSCFWLNFSRFYSAEFATIPDVPKFLKRLDQFSSDSDKEEEWSIFEKSMTKLIRYDWEPQQWFGFIHSGKATMLMHYLQSILFKFDVDENGHIDLDEGLAAYPHFSGMIKKMAKEKCESKCGSGCDQIEDDTLVKGYLHMLEFGKVPEDRWDYYWDNTVTEEVDKVGHLQLLKIFSEILVTKPQDDEKEKCTQLVPGNIVSKPASYKPAEKEKFIHD